MIEKVVKSIQKVSKSAIVIYPLVGLVSGLVTNYIMYTSDDGNDVSGYLMFWIFGFAPILIVPGIIIWCMNEFFSRMVKTIIITFLIGTVLSAWFGAMTMTIDF